MSEKKPASESAVQTFLARHRKLARIVLAVLLPLVLAGAAEGLLKVFSVGYPTSLFLKVAESDSYGMNRRFGWRFFLQFRIWKPSR